MAALDLSSAINADPALVEQLASALGRMFEEIDPIGANPDGSFSRFAWTDEDRALRSWFVGTADRLGLTVTVDHAGNQWAWWGNPADAPSSIVSTGSHLDSVPGGGRYDGPLGVLSGFAAVEYLQQLGVTPKHTLAVVNFSDEEGARVGIACFGSRVLTGVIAPDDALGMALADGAGPAEPDDTLRDALTTLGIALDTYGADPGRLAAIGAHVELHVEQGFDLVPADEPVAVASHIWPHGRWSVTFHGESNHAGTTPMSRRHDPMQQLARFIQATQTAALAHDAVATIGQLSVQPGGVNVIAHTVVASLDVRSADAENVEAVIADLAEFAPEQHSFTAATVFSTEVRNILSTACMAEDHRVPVLGTGAGHDAGILTNAGVPTGMLFVRNQTGASHTPAEEATLEDGAIGVLQLARSLMALDSIDDLGALRPSATDGATVAPAAPAGESA